MRLGAARLVDGDAETKTIAGLLSPRQHPQFFPQLFISFVALPGLTMGETGLAGERFLDNVTIDGPIPTLLEEVGIALRRNMNTAAPWFAVSAAEDRYDYPLEVVLELITNAVMHRAYSPDAQKQVQVEALT